MPPKISSGRALGQWISSKLPQTPAPFRPSRVFLVSTLVEFACALNGYRDRPDYSEP